MQTPKDIGTSFSKLISQNFINYNGCLVERKTQGFKWNSQLFYSLEELDRAINKSLNCLSKSIK